MRIAISADSHGNVAALDAVLLRAYMSNAVEAQLQAAAHAISGISEQLGQW
jgi:hypothetical protein